jgi:RNA 3'-terminal phosphate cyclase
LSSEKSSSAPAHALSMNPMEPFAPQKLVELDGRVGEGGGQLVRIASGLAALTGTPLKIHHVRGNR